MADEAPPAEPVLLFRPTKKRKAYRARPGAQDDDDDEHKQQQQQREQTGPGSRTTTSARNRRNGEAPGDNNDNNDDNNNDNDSSSSSDSDDGNYDGVAAALRARSMRRKLHGVNFQSSSNSHGGRRGADPWSLGNAPPEDDDADGAGASQVVGMSNRFMHQTGLVKDHSAKHLNEFIASRLSTRTVAPNPPDDDPLLPPESSNTTIASTAGTLRTAPAPQGVKQGRLEEVALPALPPRAPPQTQIAAPPKKVRLGPDGKPWRGRKRRASDDVKRDQLVEEFLHENRLDVYDVPKADENSASEADGAADERLAKEFRQQYLDDVARRQQSKKKKKQQQQGKKGQQQSRDARPATEVLRGPKLGGSRNSRAQVRNQLLKEKKEAAAAKK